MAELRFVDGRVDQGDGARLIGAMREEMARLYDGLDLEAPDMPRAAAADLGPPRGALLVGMRDGTAICVGGVKGLDDRACELKRMYVMPEHRGQGAARALLGALEQRARELGYTVARLDTGPRQPHAQALYSAAGYREIPNFNDNPVATFFGEKSLAG